MGGLEKAYVGVGKREEQGRIRKEKSEVKRERKMEKLEEGNK